MPDFLEQSDGIPGRAADVLKNAPSDYADLDLIAKAKMIKNTTTACNNIKNRCKEITGEANKIKTEI